MDFLLSVSVVLPICIYMAMGMAGKKLGLLDEASAAKVNSYTFKLLFPVMMFQNVLNVRDALDSSAFSLCGVLVAALIVEFFLLVLLVPVFIKDPRRQGSFIQGSFRANSILFAMPVVTAICGEENTGLASMCVAVIVPFSNVLSVVILESKRGGKVSVSGVLKGIITNPLILGAIAGGIFLLFNVRLPSFLATPVKAVASMVTPLALMLLGASLKFEGIRKDIKHLCAVCIIKLVLIPLFTLALAYACGFRGDAFVAAFALSCVPTAVSSFTMAEQMGSDGPFAGEVVAATSVASMFTVFLWVLLLSGLSII